PGVAPARVDAPSRCVRTGSQHAVAGDETDQLLLLRLPPAPGTGPDRRRGHADEGWSPSATVSSTATGTSASTGASCGTSSSLSPGGPPGSPETPSTGPLSRTGGSA